MMHLDSKQNNILFIGLLTIITMLLNAETTIYILLFPQLAPYLHININSLNYILRLYMIGLFVGSLIVGPITDCYGRKKIFLVGLLLFSIANLGCFLSTSFSSMLFWNVIEGLAAAILTVIGWVIIFDKYSMDKSCELYGLVSGLSAILLAFIPLIVYLISQLLHWHWALLLISAISLLSFFVAFFYVEETLPINKRKKFSFITTLRSYKALIANVRFMSYVLLYSFSTLIIILYFANASIVFVNSGRLSKEMFNYYQSMNSLVYIVFSFLSIYIIEKRGIDYSNKIGFYLFITGCLCISLIAKLMPSDVNIIFLCMMLATSGDALMNGFLIKAIKLYPNMKGTSMAISTAILVGLSARSIFWSQFFFDKTIFPTSLIMFVIAIISIFLYLVLLYLDKHKKA